MPTIEEALKKLAAALEALTEPGLDDTEIRRLQAVVTAVKAYEGLFANYIRYLEIEKKLVDLEAKYARLAKERTKGNASKKV